MRADKYCGMLGRFSRRDAKKIFKSGEIVLNGSPIFKPDTKLVVGDSLARTSEAIEVVVKINVTAILHKKAGYISSDMDEHGWPSYRQLMLDCPYTPLLHVVGRLDQDTEGLLLLTSDGQLNHRVISPKKKVPKVYYVEVEKNITDTDCVLLASGVELEDGTITLPAQCRLLSERSLELTLVEGKFHQVKRMLEAISNKVTYLKRVSIGGLALGSLAPGEWKMLTDSDIEMIFSSGKDL